VLQAVIAYETIEPRGLKKMVYAARAIEDQFVNEHAPEPVNLDYKTRGAITHALKSRMKAIEKLEHYEEKGYYYTTPHTHFFFFGSFLFVLFGLFCLFGLFGLFSSFDSAARTHARTQILCWRLRTRRS
jgi:hypothetical protein